MQNEIVQAAHNDMAVLSGSANDEFYAAIELFRKMQKHCNFIDDMELEDMNDAVKLREVIQNLSYLLAITAQKNDTLKDLYSQINGQKEKMRVELNGLAMAK